MGVSIESVTFKGLPGIADFTVNRAEILGDLGKLIAKALKSQEVALTPGSHHFEIAKVDKGYTLAIEGGQAKPVTLRGFDKAVQHTSKVARRKGLKVSDSDKLCVRTMLPPEAPVGGCFFTNMDTLGVADASLTDVRRSLVIADPTGETYGSILNKLSIGDASVCFAMSVVGLKDAIGDAGAAKRVHYVTGKNVARTSIGGNIAAMICSVVWFMEEFFVLVKIAVSRACMFILDVICFAFFALSGMIFAAISGFKSWRNSRGILKKLDGYMDGTESGVKAAVAYLVDKVTLTPEEICFIDNDSDVTDKAKAKSDLLMRKVLKFKQGNGSEAMGLLVTEQATLQDVLLHPSTCDYKKTEALIGRIRHASAVNRRWNIFSAFLGLCSATFALSMIFAGPILWVLILSISYNGLGLITTLYRNRKAIGRKIKAKFGKKPVDGQAS